MARKNKKREAGSGSITKRKDGRWEGRYTAGYDPETGKRIIKNVLGKTQAEVKEKLKAVISESQRLDVSKAGTYTVSLWMKMWYEVYAEPRIRPNTKAYYTNYIENHIVPGIGNIPLDKLTTIQIQRFYNTLQKSGRVQRKNFPELKDKSLSPRVVRGVHTLLRNCLEQAVAERLILSNPAQGCKLPQLEKKEMKILPQEKIGMYLAEAERRGLLAAFYLAVAALAGAASFAAAGFTYAAASPLGDLALFLGLAWLLAFAYGCTTAVIVWATRSAGAGVAWALVVSSGIAGSLLGQVLLLLGRGVPWIGALEPWTLASCMQNVGNHASTLLATPAAAPLTMAPLAVQVLIVGTAAVALCAALTFGPLRKRDL